jgi:hypothetical protein
MKVGEMLMLGMIIVMIGLSIYGLIKFPCHGVGW